MALLSAELCNSVFDRCIADYHRTDHVDAPKNNPFTQGIEVILYDKTWIDTVQWHLEDLARIPDILDKDLAALKRRIDLSNQARTDCVERVDDWFLRLFKDSRPAPGATMNSETPAWLIDRMSILALKIYHMREETERPSADATHREKCRAKLGVLSEQRRDLSVCLDELIQDIQSGRKFMKVYRQMKMYNDETLNPALYGREKLAN